MSKRTFSNKDLQLKQQIIHYKSELARQQKKISEYEGIIDKYRKQQILLKENIKNQGYMDLETHEEMINNYRAEIEKEKENFQLLQEEYEKLKVESETLQSNVQKIQSEKDSIYENQKKLEHNYDHLLLEKDQLLTQYEEAVAAYEKLKKESTIKSKKHSIEAHFSYSVMLPNLDQGEKDILVIGNFIIKNTGDVPLSKPVICIRVNPVGYGQLSGKFGPTSVNFKDKLVDESAGEMWAYIHDNWKEKVRKEGEYWLKPLFTERLNPGEILTFTTFNLSIHQPIEKNSVSVEGYSYFNEISKGVSASNQIAINY